jgi:Family of unknown function (DUF6535)
VSVQDLRPSSQDISAFYLQNIYQILADHNLPQVTIPSPVASPPPFSPPRYAIWVNSLWFLSLLISLTCALLATSLHQWARRYVTVTQPARCSPEKRARLRAFYADGVNQVHVSWAVEALPTLLRSSLFLFFFGLVIFLFNVNHSVFLSAAWWIGLFSAVYACITFIPIFRPASPYYTPLSALMPLVLVSILKLTMVLVKVILFPCVWIATALCITTHYCFICSWTIICSCTMMSGRNRLSDADPSGSMRTYLVHHGKETWHCLIQAPYRIKMLFDDTCFDPLYWDCRFPAPT